MTFCQLDESKKRLSVKGESLRTMVDHSQSVDTLAEFTRETTHSWVANQPISGEISTFWAQNGEQIYSFSCRLPAFVLILLKLAIFSVMHISWFPRLFSQVMKLPCTSPSRCRNLSTGMISSDVSLVFFPFSSNVLLWISCCLFRCTSQFRCWWSSESDPVADQEMWFCCVSFTIGFDTSNIPDNKLPRSSRSRRVSHQLWTAEVEAHSRQVTSYPWDRSGFCVQSEGLHCRGSTKEQTI